MLPFQGWLHALVLLQAQRHCPLTVMIPPYLLYNVVSLRSETNE
jgi:hypothetical protein